MKNTYFIFGALIVACGLAGCSKVAPIYNVDHQAMPANIQKLTESEIGKIIQETAAKRGWDCRKISATKFICSLQKCKHQAKAELNYSRYHFSIHEVESIGLQQNQKGEIHKKYNKWIKTLQSDIVKELNAHGLQK